MYTDDIVLIDKKIEELIKDETLYNFDTLKQKVALILNGADMFMVDGVLDLKAVDLYLKKVISKRNEIQKEKEKSKLNETPQTKYVIIEAICQKSEFETQEELIKTIEELEKKTNFELSEILKRSWKINFFLMKDYPSIALNISAVTSLTSFVPSSSTITPKSV